MDLPQVERDYDLATPEIKCNADKPGAKIFRVPAITGSEDAVRVLAFDRKAAADCGRKHSIERAAARYMSAPLVGVEAIED